MVAGDVFYVPWPDISEWNNVREQIFSANVQDTIAAYRTILMWKLKYDSVPTYIECTYSLLQVMVKEYEMTRNEQASLLFNEHDLQLSYSTALIRFVNHISSISSYKGETLYLAAKTQNIPDWIINMRHDVAHGQDLPALNALHVAAELSLKWLLDNYWGNSETIEPKPIDESHIDIESGFTNEIDTDAQNVFNKFFDIWEFCNNAKYKKTKFVNDLDREFMLHLEELLSLNMVYFHYLENEAAVGIQSIVNSYSLMEESGEVSPIDLYPLKEFKSLLLKFIKNIIKGRELLKHSLVMSLFETTFLSEATIKPRKWEPVLRLLHETGCFSFLLEILFQMAGKGHVMAAKWLSALPPSLLHLKKQWAIFKVLRKENKNFKTKLLRKKVQSSCTPSHPRSMIISLDIFKPPAIRLDMVKNILLNPEQFSVKVIVAYLKMVKPPLMDFTVDMIKDLVSLHLVGNVRREAEEGARDRVYTVEDLDRVLEMEGQAVFEETATYGDGWIRSGIDVSAWNRCPLGLLPFQTKVDCNLPRTLSWERQDSGRKRVSIPLLAHSANMKKFREV